MATSPLKAASLEWRPDNAAEWEGGAQVFSEVSQPPSGTSLPDSLHAGRLRRPPDVAFVTEKGRQLGVDLGLLARMERPGVGTVSAAVYLVGVTRGALNESADTVYCIVAEQTLQDAVRHQLADYVASSEG